VRCPLIGHRLPLAALHNHSLDCCAAGTLSVSFILSPCNPALASLSLPRPRSHRLLRRLSPVLGAPITCPQKPQLRLWSAFNPTSIDTVVVASCARSPTPRSHLPRRLPARVLVLKSASVPPSSRPPEAIDQSTTPLLRPRYRTSRVSTLKWLSHGPDHCPHPSRFL
jgi:hypothetical protein